MRALPGESRRVPAGSKPLARKDAALEQRRRILRVTADLIAKRGYGGTTTELIVRRARVGYGTFYKFFASKEAAFLALFDETFETTGAVIAAAYGGEGDGRPWAERIGAAIRTFYAAIASDPQLWRACLVEALTAGPEVLGRYESSIRELAGLLRRGREESADAAVLPKALEETLAGGIVWIAYQRLVAGEAATELPALLPEAIQFSLSPYLGEREAAAFAARYAAESPAASP